MVDNTNDAVIGEQPAVFKVDSSGPLSVSDAADAISKAREAPVTEKQPDEETPPSPPAAEPPAAPDDTALPDEAPGDTTEEAVPAVDLPPIEPPRSWSKEDKELFAALPRETQERTAQSWQARERDINRRQQEAAEQRKALEAERQQTAQVRQQYEQALPNVLAAAQTQLNSEFPEIKTWADAEKLQAEDFVRYQKFDLIRQKKLAAQQELNALQQQQAAASQREWATYSRDEDAKFEQLAPEMADPERARTLRENASKMMTDVGFKEEELRAAMEGRAGFYVKDHRVQLLIRDAALWREAQAKAKQARQAPVPPVLKPGTARSTSADASAADIARVSKELSQASGRRAIELATQLQQLKRSAS
jgi:hypothetical protein